MRIFIYKFLIGVVLTYFLFEFTIGYRINALKSEINKFTEHKARIEFKEKIKEELQKGIEKEYYFDEEERYLLSTFINKLKKELDISDLEEK